MPYFMVIFQDVVDFQCVSNSTGGYVICDIGNPLPTDSSVSISSIFNTAVTAVVDSENV